MAPTAAKTAPLGPNHDDRRTDGRSDMRLSWLLVSGHSALGTVELGSYSRWTIELASSETRWFARHSSPQNPP
jgi:hypothetical protein